MRADKKEHPLLFKSEMVRAILAGDKTQTRRPITKLNCDCPAGLDNLDIDKAVIKQPSMFCDSQYFKAPHKVYDMSDVTTHRIFPKWRIGDRIWVRETWQKVDPGKEVNFPIERLGKFSPYKGIDNGRPINWQAVYRADGEIPNHPKYGKLNWRPSIFMPRWACRILLEITDIGAMRPQGISEEDAKAEGVEYYNPKQWNVEQIKQARLNGNGGIMAGKFSQLWDGINFKRGYGWDRNWPTWAYTFKEIKT